MNPARRRCLLASRRLQVTRSGQTLSRPFVRTRSRLQSRPSARRPLSSTGRMQSPCRKLFPRLARWCTMGMRSKVIAPRRPFHLHERRDTYIPHRADSSQCQHGPQYSERPPDSASGYVQRSDPKDPGCSEWGWYRLGYNRTCGPLFGPNPDCQGILSGSARWWLSGCGDDRFLGPYPHSRRRRESVR